MEALVITWRELLIAVVAVLGVYVAEMLLIARLARTGFRPRRWGIEASDETAALRKEVGELRGLLETLRKEVDNLRSGRAAPSPYSQAIQLAQQGLDASAVAAKCGISRGEAELIIALYRTHSL